ncbi:SMI1/KNR4 family protein [Streptomyces sp. UNOC14_S4]|uniref:SMI1/KNR4 family protein n=1 Tax=Streptomyces sp. UNOC14_S4 TaxID=2872340 RepID=UPI001E47D836|nr:SMI1/KNR4 family protein [Streptomyces sp. UNOC14_S4]MCC3770174.1 SMI1/KNR4 family protein [Streptomyces sp. UNOC14_S4]
MHDDLTDDLIGTQAPAHRIGDPAEAIRVLERAVPGLVAYRRAEPAALGWAVPESELGTALPADFKLLAELYPTFVIGDFLSVALPGPGAERGWADGVRDGLETVIRDWWEGGMSIGLPPHPAPGGLLPWGESLHGDVFLWTTTGPGPDAWPVTVASRNGGWWHYEGGVVQFLAELLDGSLEAWGLPDIRTDDVAAPGR